MSLAAKIAVSEGFSVQQFQRGLVSVRFHREPLALGDVRLQPAFRASRRRTPGHAVGRRRRRRSHARFPGGPSPIRCSVARRPPITSSLATMSAPGTTMSRFPATTAGTSTAANISSVGSVAITMPSTRSDMRPSTGVRSRWALNEGSATATRNPRGASSIVQSGQQVDEPEVPVVIQDHADGPGPVAGEGRCGAAGTVVQPFNGLLDGGPAGRRNAGRTAQTPARPGTLIPRPRRLRHKCSGVCRFPASPCHCDPCPPLWRY